jgi:hypothetical protein
MIPVNEKNAEQVAKTVKDTPVCSAGSVRRSLSIANLATAMVAVQKQIEDPTKNKRADAGRAGSYRYADLPTVLDVVRPALTANGFTVMQFPCEMEGEPALTTILIHSASGEWIETTVKIRPADSRPQAVGSAQTYARRYALLALCGIAADDDDDGRAASKPAPAQQQQQKPAQPTDWAKDFVKQVDAATTREQGGKLWGIYDADAKVGKVSPADKIVIDEAFKRFGQRCPKPAEQPAAK